MRYMSGVNACLGLRQQGEKGRLGQCGVGFSRLQNQFEKAHPFRNFGSASCPLYIGQQFCAIWLAICLYWSSSSRKSVWPTVYFHPIFRFFCFRCVSPFCPSHHSDRDWLFFFSLSRLPLSFFGPCLIRIGI